MTRLIFICLGLLPFSLLGQYVYFNNAQILENVNAELYSDIIVRLTDYAVMTGNVNDTAIYLSLTEITFDGNVNYTSAYIQDGFILPNLADSYMPHFAGSVFAGGAGGGSYRYSSYYDEEFNQIYSSVYPLQDSSATEEFHGLGIVTASDFTAFGVRFYNSDDDPWMESCRIEVSRIDMDGNILQQGLIDPAYSDFYRVNQIFELPNGFFVLNGIGYSQSDCMTLLLDENYELLQSHFWGDEELNEGHFWSVQEADPWYFTSAYPSTSYLDALNRPWSKINLRRTKEPNHDIFWDIEFPYEHPLFGPSKILHTPDGGYAIMGTGVITSDEGIQSFLLKTDSLGNEEWFKTYTHFDNPESLNKLYDIEISPDGGFIAVGETQTNDPFNPTPQSGWILKLDACGDVEWEGCEYVGLEPTAEVSPINVYPNPASNALHVDWNSHEPAHVLLRDLSGRVVKTYTHHPPTSTLDITGVPSGVYLIELQDGARVLASKVVVSNN